MKVSELLKMNVSNRQLADITGIGTKRAVSKARRGLNDIDVNQEINLTVEQIEQLEKAVESQRFLIQERNDRTRFESLLKQWETVLVRELELQTDLSIAFRKEEDIEDAFNAYKEAVNKSKSVKVEVNKLQSKYKLRVPYVLRKADKDCISHRKRNYKLMEAQSVG